MKPGFINGVSNNVKSAGFVLCGRHFMFIIPCFLFIYLIFSGCGKKTEMIGLTFNGDSTPVIHTENVMTLISDSGVTRYRIKARIWDIYDKAKEPYWFFPEKIYVERFDSLLAVEGSIEADTAYFYKLKHLWRLAGNVKVLNLEGETFETSELFWDQRAAMIYTDDSVRVQRKDEVVTGIGFRSNQEMTRFSFYRSGVQMNIREEEDSVQVKTEE
jgi:LPS export ABC transporter protein LptC